MQQCTAATAPISALPRKTLVYEERGRGCVGRKVKGGIKKGIIGIDPYGGLKFWNNAENRRKTPIIEENTAF